ncbi:MAG TPA: hypothetical protein VMV21_10995 [Vicinamibacteria bacterium]|nr:hypothetical protein [Vicinamibacteria bacterium]
MNAELIADFDSATQALDALAAAAVEQRPSIQERLTRDIADCRVHGLDPDAWHTRWIHGPLRAIRVLEGLRLKFMVELDEVRQQLREVEAELSLLREAGHIADAEFGSRKAVRLLCHEADVRERLDAPVANRITAARNGIARILEVSLRHAGHELLRLARDSAQPGAEPGAAQEAMNRAEAFNRLVAEAHRVTGGLDVPVFLPEHVARLRSAATVRAAGGTGTGAAAAMPTVKVPVITQDLLAARAAAAGKPLSTPKVGPPIRPASGAAAATVPGPAPSRPGEAPKTKPSLPRLRGVIAGA